MCKNGGFLLSGSHIHNILSQAQLTSKQSLGIKVARLVKWISGHVCKLLLTTFSNSNSSNHAMFLFVLTSFDVAKQSVMGRVLPNFVGVG